MNNKTEKIESPCVRNCCLDENNICLGCFRSIDEIIQWGSINDGEKISILERTKARAKLKVNRT